MDSLGFDPARLADVVPALVDITLKGTVLLAIAAIATTLFMRRAAAATRHLVWSAAVAGVLALPVVRIIAPAWSMPMFAISQPTVVPPVAAAPIDIDRGTRSMPSPVVEPSAGVDRLSAPVSQPSVERVPTVETAATTSIEPAVAKSKASVPFAAWLVMVWAFGALAILSRLAIGTVALARLARRSRNADDVRWTQLLQQLTRELGIRRPVTLLVGGADTVPMTWGVVYPVVLLPPDAAKWTDDRRRAVLLHELAHVERFDTLTHIMSQVAVAVLWFNPLAIIATRRLRAERERACDDLVLAAGGVRATAYADDLLELVQAFGATRALSAGLAMARKSEFEGRLLSILDPSAPRVRTDRRRAALAAVCMAMAALPLAGLRNATAAERAGSASGPAGPASGPASGSASGSASPTAAVPDSTPLSVPRLRGGPAAPSLAPSFALTKPSAPVASLVQSGAQLVAFDNPARLAALARQLDDVRAKLEATGRRQALAEGQEQSDLSSAAVADFARAVTGMTSDSDKAAVLLKLIPRATSTAPVRAAFVEALKSMSGNNHQRRVLVPLVQQLADDSMMLGALSVVRTMSSDTEGATVLGAIAMQRRMTSPVVRERYFAAVDAMSSESSRQASLLAAIRAEPANDGVSLGAIKSAAQFASDGARANVLLEVATTTNALNTPATRTQFLNALQKITSSTDYRRVMDVVVK